MNRIYGRSPRPRFFFFNDTATTEIYTLSLHDALPISSTFSGFRWKSHPVASFNRSPSSLCKRSEEHTSELQSLTNLVCRLLLEKKKSILQNNDSWHIVAANLHIDRPKQFDLK